MIRQYIFFDEYGDATTVEGLETGNVSVEFNVDGETRTMVFTPDHLDELNDAIANATFDASQLKEEHERSIG